LLAIGLDLALGEPANRFHPVAWLGSGIEFARRRAPQRGWLLPLLAGLLITMLGTALAVFAGWLAQSSSDRLPLWAAILVQGAMLKTTFSIRGLTRAGRNVESALLDHDLPAARRLVRWHLVSRDTSQLNESQVAAATIESLAENLSDSIIAPLLFYLVAGLPGALAYRFINTCDAVLGYHDHEREWLGKIPARADDLANLLPSRLSAVALWLAAMLSGHDVRRAIAIWYRDRRLTASPNAGHPMTAAAGALGVQLEKMGHYRLGDGLRLPEAQDIASAVRLVWLAAGLAGGAIGVVLFLV
jgi:adenosylcobinamide-phosphate synthase